jgi:hypothetical protein
MNPCLVQSMWRQPSGTVKLCRIGVQFVSHAIASSLFVRGLQTSLLRTHGRFTLSLLG